MLSTSSALNSLRPIHSTETLSKCTDSLKKVSEVLKAKIERIWQAFVASIYAILETLHILPTQSTINAIAKKADIAIEEINTKEKEFNSITIPQDASPEVLEAQLKVSLEKKQHWINSFEQGLITTLADLKAAHITPTRMPKKIAHQLGEMLTRYAITLYSNPEAPNGKFQTSLDVLKLGILVHQYALGLRSACPDLSKMKSLKEIIANAPSFAAEADQVIFNMDPKLWSQKAGNLSQTQLLNLVTHLRYCAGAIRYLDNGKRTPASLQFRDALLRTAEKCLQSGLTNPSYVFDDIKDHLAELKYNEMTGLLAVQAEQATKAGQSDKAEALTQELHTVCEEMIMLSKKPTLMKARITNKSAAALLTPHTTEEKIAKFKQAIAIYQTLDKTEQDPLLLALWHNNLSLTIQELEDDHLKEAFESANEAWAICIELKAKGINDSQMKSVEDNYLNLIEKMKEKLAKQRNEMETLAAKHPKVFNSPEFINILKSEMQKAVEKNPELLKHPQVTEPLLQHNLSPEAVK